MGRLSPAVLLTIGLAWALGPTLRAQDVTVEEDRISLQFDEIEGTPIEEFIKLAQELTGHQLNYNKQEVEQVRLRMIGAKSMRISEFWSYFQAVLKANELLLVYYGPIDGTNDPRAPGFFKIARASSLGSGGRVGALKSGAPVIPPERLVEFRNDPNIVLTTSFALKYVAAQDAMNMLTAYFSDPLIESVRAINNSNSLVVTGFAQTLFGARSLIELLDVKPTVYELKFAKVELEHGSAEDVKTIVDAMIDADRGVAGGNRGGAVPQGASGLPPALQEQAPHLEADPRTNAIYVLAAPGTLEKIIGWIRQLDVEVDPRGDTHVYRLKNSAALDLAEVLNEWASKLQNGTGTGQGAGGAANQAGTTSALSQQDNLVIEADEASNSLIISASKSRYAQVLEIVKRLDVRRRQVLIETALIEISGTLNERLGVELGYVSSDGTATQDGGFGVSSFSLSSLVDVDGDGIADQRVPGALIPGPSGTQGITAGIFSEEFGVPVIVNALKTTTDANVLSMPSVLVNDNEPATLESTDEVPTFVTSQGQVSDQTSFDEYQTAGITLSISPSISAGNYLRLQVELNVSTFTGSGSPPPRATRQINTQVTLPDGHTMVVGGIIADDSRTTSNKVPWLGEAPWLGWLFRTNSDNSTRTNLYVFITPHIIADDFSTLDDLSYAKKREMEALNGKIAVVDPDWDRDVADTRLLDASVSGVFDLPSYASPPGGEREPQQKKSKVDDAYFGEDPTPPAGE